MRSDYPIPDYRKKFHVEEIQYHIKCKRGDIAPYVLVSGDPDRIEKIISLMSNCREVAKNRGLQTYTGFYKDIPISTCSTGMGGPSAAIVFEELINIGAKVIIRIGSMAGLQPGVKEGDTIIPFAVVRDDGVSQYYVPENFPAVADPDIYNALCKAANSLNIHYHTGISWTHSAFYHRSNEYFQRWCRCRVISLDMEASMLFTLAYLRGIKSGMIGTCFANRGEQTKDSQPDLHVPSIDRHIIQNGVLNSIRIALEAISFLSES